MTTSSTAGYKRRQTFDANAVPNEYFKDGLSFLERGKPERAYAQFLIAANQYSQKGYKGHAQRVYGLMERIKENVDLTKISKAIAERRLKVDQKSEVYGILRAEERELAKTIRANLEPSVGEHEKLSSRKPPRGENLKDTFSKRNARKLGYTK